MFFIDANRYQSFLIDLNVDWLAALQKISTDFTVPAASPFPVIFAGAHKLFLNLIRHGAIATGMYCFWSYSSSTLQI